jgi:hypothetical protein
MPFISVMKDKIGFGTAENAFHKHDERQNPDWKS